MVRRRKRWGLLGLSYLDNHHTNMFSHYGCDGSASRSLNQPHQFQGPEPSPRRILGALLPTREKRRGPRDPRSNFAKPNPIVPFRDLLPDGTSGSASSFLPRPVRWLSKNSSGKISSTIRLYSDGSGKRSSVNPLELATNKETQNATSCEVLGCVTKGLD